MYQQYIKENGIDEKLETYRKIKMSPEFQKRLYKMLDSGIYVDEAFMSTSIHNTAELEFDLLMTIDANYSDGAFIAPLSAIEGESEFLIDRNIPFVIMGIIMIILHFIRRNDKSYRFMWLAILLSFAFYLPVVLWADVSPMIGMLMLPKTCMYVWIVVMGYRDVKNKTLEDTVGENI